MRKRRGLFEPLGIRRNPDGFLLVLLVLTDQSELEER
jgi:hypothetical protein